MPITSTNSNAARLTACACPARGVVPVMVKAAAVVLLSAVACGCGQVSREPDARTLARRAEESYRAAARAYEKLVAAGTATDATYAELGELYLRHGDYQRATQVLQRSSLPGAAKHRGQALYFLGDATGALEVFNRIESADDEARYYHGLTCEKLNLYDQALELYGKVAAGPFAAKAAQRVHEISRSSGGERISAVDPRTAEAIARAPAESDYPQAGALILNVEESVELSAAGTSVSTMRLLVKILNERGKEAYSEAQIAYDSTFEKVEIEYARVIKPDGTIVDVGARHVRDVSRYLNFPLYSNARVRIISFPEIGSGSVIEYKARIFDSELIAKKHSSFGYSLKAHDPIIAARFTLSVPGERKVSLKTVNERYNESGAVLQPRVEESGTSRTCSWVFSRIPQLVPEQGMPPEVEINPMVAVSTFESWDEIYAWWWGLARGKIAADDDIRRAVAEITAGLDTPRKKARALYNFCARQIRYVAVEYGQAGHEPHKAADIFRNKYGDCKDQAVLLTTMLREAGLKAYPVLIPTRECFNLCESFPAVIFNHCIAVVELEGERIFLDPTAETCAFGDLPVDDQRRRVMIFREDGYELAETPLSDAAHNLTRQRLVIGLKPDGGIEAEKNVSTSGVYDQGQRYWLLYTMPDVVRETLSEKIQQVSVGAVLKGYEALNVKDLNTPVELRYSFRGPEYGLRAGPLQILPPFASLDVSVAARDARRYPLDFRFAGRSESIFEIALPPGYKVQYLPSDVAQDSPWMKCDVSYEHKGGRIIARQTNVLKTSTIEPEDYPAFQSFIRAAAQQMRESVVLSAQRK